MSSDYDVIVIGAGAVGLACAAELSAHVRVLVVEKEPRLGAHQSSRNSEVLHAGLYYPPGSLKAKLCVEGRSTLLRWADQGHVTVRQIGKLIVASDAAELVELRALRENAAACGVDVHLLDPAEVAKIEPNVKAAAALWSPESGILDSHSLLHYQQRRILAQGGDVVLHSEWTKAEKTFRSDSPVAAEEPAVALANVSARLIINAAGLYADQIAETLGINLHRHRLHQHWNKGVYFTSPAARPGSLSHLIYPLPSRDGRTLGVHATLDLGGQIRFGPTSGYVRRDRTPDYVPSVPDVAAVRAAIGRYFPAIESAELEPVMAGIRAKLQGPGDGFRDFVILDGRRIGLPRQIHLLGIDSPGLTASPAIGRLVKQIALAAL